MQSAPYKSTQPLQNSTRRLWASSTSSYVIDGLTSRRQALTNFIQLRKCCSGRWCFKTNGEYTIHHDRHWSAFMYGNCEANFVIQIRISRGRHDSICQWLHFFEFFTSSSARSVHTDTTRWAVPKNKLCIGSIIVEVTGPKYSRRWSSDHLVPVLYSILRRPA